MATDLQACTKLVDPSMGSVAGFSSDQDELRFIVVGKPLFRHVQLQKALREFAVLISYSETGVEHLDDADSDTVFIVEDFKGDVYKTLHAEECRIVAPPVVIRAAMAGEGLPYTRRPVYCTIMEGVTVCFSGLKQKEELTNLANLVHHMGGSIRKNYSVSVTHLVSARAGGDKYRTAVGMGVHIMSVDWVMKCWECRDDPTVSATDDNLMRYKLNPFSFCALCFFGFSNEDLDHMNEVSIANGGTCVDMESPDCTHLIVNDHTVKSLSLAIQDKVYIVKAEWFWASIQMEACADESIYLFEATDENDSTTLYGNGLRRTTSNVTLSGSRSHRRKRLRDNLARLAQDGETPLVKIRRAPSTNITVLEKSQADLSDTIIGEKPSPQIVVANALRDLSKLTPRQQSIVELLQTECNYVDILNTILKVFKEEIERTNQPGGPILDPQESKAVFGGIPPIHEVHSKICDDLCETVSSESWVVGKIFLNHADALSKSYPNFVNYFEKTKEAIQQCDNSKPRFHAFLRLCQSKAECGRQTLAELLIRPVQRLPSMLLLLRDILKRTVDTQPDYEQLTKAITGIEEVMTHINEDKRRTEAHQTLFSIVNDIENCPPNLLSAHRVFVQRVNVVEVSGELSGKGNPLTMFVFSDSLEVTKNRTKGLATKSPSTSKGVQKKVLKHLSLIPFSSIKRIVDIIDSQECCDVFSLIVKKHDDSEEKLYSFVIGDDGVKKTEFLTGLSKAICASQCRTDYETLLAVVEAHVLNIDVSDINNTKLFARAATRFGRQVSRVLSSNKTPQNTMKRAFSSTSQTLTPTSGRDSTISTSSLSSWSQNSSNYSRCVFPSEVSESGDECFDSYSDIVDLMSLGSGTPLGTAPLSGKRRETLMETTSLNGKIPDKGSLSGKISDKLSVGGKAKAAYSSQTLRPTSTRQSISTAVTKPPVDVRCTIISRRGIVGSTQSLVAPSVVRKLDSSGPVTSKAKRQAPSVVCRPGETCL